MEAGEGSERKDGMGGRTPPDEEQMRLGRARVARGLPLDEGDEAGMSGALIGGGGDRGVTPGTPPRPRRSFHRTPPGTPPEPRPNAASRSFRHRRRVARSRASIQAVVRPGPRPHPDRRAATSSAASARTAGSRRHRKRPCRRTAAPRSATLCRSLCASRSWSACSGSTSAARAT